MTIETPSNPVDPVAPPRFRGPRWAIGGVVALVVIGLGIWFAATLTRERATKIFDLMVAGLVVGLLSWAARYLLRGEVLRRSRLVAAELIGVTFGGAALATIFMTASSQAVGVSRLPALISIQLLSAVLGGGATFMLAFFITLGVKASAKLFRRQRPEAEAVFIGIVTGAVGGTLATEVAERGGAWFPFLAAAVCAVTTYRAVILHRRYDR